MQIHLEHEHWFVDHEDPRWLICDCGQHAVRTRNITGDRIVRLIDPPRPVFIPRPTASVVDERDSDVRELDLAGSDL